MNPANTENTNAGSQRFRDAEARVIGSVGHHQWECELYVSPHQICTLFSYIRSVNRPNGVRFRAHAGTTEFYKRWQLKHGDIVSFKHHGFLLASKKPNLPALYRLRPDLTWAQVVSTWKERKPNPTGSAKLPVPVALSISSSALPPVRPHRIRRANGYWRNIENRRKFLIHVAEELAFNPFQPTNWANVSRREINKRRVSLSLLLLSRTSSMFPFYREQDY